MGLDKGIASISPRCKSNMAFPSSFRTSAGNDRITSRAAGWNIAAFTSLMSHI